MWSSSGCQLASIAKYDRPVFNVSFSPDAKHVLVTGALPSFHILDITQSSNIKDILDIVSANELERKEGGTNELAINSMKISSNDRNSYYFGFNMER